LPQPGPTPVVPPLLLDPSPLLLLLLLPLLLLSPPLLLLPVLPLPPSVTGPDDVGAPELELSLPVDSGSAVVSAAGVVGEGVEPKLVFPSSLPPAQPETATSTPSCPHHPTIRFSRIRRVSAIEPCDESHPMRAT